MDRSFLKLLKDFFVPQTDFLGIKLVNPCHKSFLQCNFKISVRFVFNIERF